MVYVHKVALKKYFVSGPAAKCVYYCRMGTFFFILPKKIFWVKISSFSWEKKRGKKKILRPPDWPQFRPSAG